MWLWSSAVDGNYKDVDTKVMRYESYIATTSTLIKMTTIMLGMITFIVPPVNSNDKEEPKDVPKARRHPSIVFFFGEMRWNHAIEMNSQARLREQAVVVVVVVYKH